jgi:hypothetical protein
MLEGHIIAYPDCIYDIVKHQITNESYLLLRLAYNAIIITALIKKFYLIKIIIRYCIIYSIYSSRLARY